MVLVRDYPLGVADVNGKEWNVLERKIPLTIAGSGLCGTLWKFPDVLMVPKAGVEPARTRFTAPSRQRVYQFHHFGNVVVYLG